MMPISHDAMPPLIEAVEVGKRFGGGLGREGTLALASLSLAIDAERPSVIAVVGESGSGKTTLARLLLGLVEPTEGMVRYRGQDLRRLGFEARRTFRRDVQAIFQDPYGVYNPFYRVDHVLTVPVRRFGLATSRADARDLIGEGIGNLPADAEDRVQRIHRPLRHERDAGKPQSADAVIVEIGDAGIV